MCPDTAAIAYMHRSRCGRYERPHHSVTQNWHIYPLPAGWGSIENYCWLYMAHVTAMDTRGTFLGCVG
eukprot:COSAG01_NODE_49370_length_372_cov_7.571429_1_plen_67_part_10